MKKALIDTQTSVQHIVSWEETPNGILPIYETYANSCRVCEVCDNEFEVYKTLIWVDCADNIVSDEFWYDNQSGQINPVENAPIIEPTQPATEGIESV